MKIFKTLNRIDGSSLAEFATTTALMATLAATAAPKLSEMAESSKQEKTMNEIDKIIQQGQQFYQETTDLEGRGRFPGQGRFDMTVGGYNHDGRTTVVNDTSSVRWQEIDQIHNDLIGLPYFHNYAGIPNWTGGYFVNFEDDHAAGWLSVFGLNSEARLPKNHNLHVDDTKNVEGENNCINCQGTEKTGHEEWLDAFGGETLSSPFQDGHYIYRVIPGYGTGKDSEPPILYVADLENPANFNAVLIP